MKTVSTISCVVAVLVALALTLGYTFWFSEVVRMQDQVSALASQIVTKTREYVHASENRTALQEVVEHETEVNAHFAPTSAIVTFLESIEQLGRAYGTTVTVVSVTGSATDGKLTLALSVSGTFDAVMRTLGFIEHGQFASATKSLTLETTENNDWTAALTVVVLTKTTP